MITNNRLIWVVSKTKAQKGDFFLLRAAYPLQKAFSAQRLRMSDYLLDVLKSVCANQNATIQLRQSGLVSCRHA